ncbi:factor H binding protein domain-containing protein [Glaesserella sp.]|uniref:factor H binding protein domain-containing protein n=1 Tax=Glaesserella sp. TaxID=2094731 RepID=UPI00359F9054
MKVFGYSYTILTLGLLTACGGGGGSGGTTASASGTQVTPTDSNPQPSIVYVTDTYKDFVKEAKKVTIIDSNDKVIKEIVLANHPKGIIRESFTVDNVTEYLKGINQAYSATTAIYNLGDSGVAKTANIMGLPTSNENMPKQGKYTYQGHSIGLDNQGKLTLVADFDTKSVNGKIYALKQDNGVALSDIVLRQGNFYRGQFTGKNQTFDATMFRGTTSNAGYYVGSFTGPNAEEVVGTLLKSYNQDPYAIFAGEKQ